jgi:hypothetical protein
VANRGKTKLEIRIKNAGGGYAFHAPVLPNNGKLKTFGAVVNGKQEVHPEGVYYLRYTNEQGKRVYERIGKDPSEALNLLRRRQLGTRKSRCGSARGRPNGHASMLHTPLDSLNLLPMFL